MSERGSSDLTSAKMDLRDVTDRRQLWEEWGGGAIGATAHANPDPSERRRAVRRNI